jgi:hypothetical protein
MAAGPVGENIWFSNACWSINDDAKLTVSLRVSVIRPGRYQIKAFPETQTFGPLHDYD